MAKRTANRRAVVVLTDGADTTSAYTPDQVAEIASAVDVPVYVVIWDSPPAGVADRDRNRAACRPWAGWRTSPAASCSSPATIPR